MKNLKCSYIIVKSMPERLLVQKTQKENFSLHPLSSLSLERILGDICLWYFCCCGGSFLNYFSLVLLSLNSEGNVRWDRIAQSLQSTPMLQNYLLIYHYAQTNTYISGSHKIPCIYFRKKEINNDQTPKFLHSLKEYLLTK